MPVGVVGASQRGSSNMEVTRGRVAAPVWAAWVRERGWRPDRDWRRVKEGASGRAKYQENNRFRAWGGGKGRLMVFVWRRRRGGRGVEQQGNRHTKRQVLGLEERQVV